MLLRNESESSSYTTGRDSLELESEELILGISGLLGVIGMSMAKFFAVKSLAFIIDQGVVSCSELKNSAEK